MISSNVPLPEKNDSVSLNGPQCNQDLNSDDSIEVAEPFWGKKDKYKGLKKFIRFLCFFLGGIFILAVAVFICVAVWIKQFYEPINAEGADKTKLVGWLVLRDFEKESPEVRAALLKRYLRPMGREDISVDLSSTTAQKVIPIAQGYMQERDQKLEQWEKSRLSRPLTAVDYKIVPISPDQKWITSQNIKPTQSLLDYLEEIKDMKMIPDADSKAENNIRLMMKDWFAEQMREYDNAPDNQKVYKIQDSAFQLSRFSRFYNLMLAKLDLPPQGDQEQMRDLRFMTDGWFENTPPEELAKLLWFKDLVLSITIRERSGMGGDVEDLIRAPRKKSETQSSAGKQILQFLKANSANADSETESTETDENDSASEEDSSSKENQSAEDEENSADFF